MSETETLTSPATADVVDSPQRVATTNEAPATPSKPKSPAKIPTTTRDHNLTIIDPATKLGGGYTEAEKDELTKLYDQTFSALKPDQVLMGRVVAITGSEVAVDIGFKSEGMIPRSEFGNDPNLAVGDEVEVLLEAIEDREGRLQLSRKRADFIRVWERINDAAKTGEVLSVKVIRRIKGGLVVDLMGIEAFMPGSQIDTKPVRDFDAYLNQTMDVRVVKINHPSENV
ncbi:MAG: S1 RNA-binding domain-containing protein, partial [Ignavibacteriota bacterium]